MILVDYNQNQFLFLFYLKNGNYHLWSTHFHSFHIKSFKYILLTTQYSLQKHTYFTCAKLNKYQILKKIMSADRFNQKKIKNKTQPLCVY